jgi:hypothetical protein
MIVTDDIPGILADLFCPISQLRQFGNYLSVLHAFFLRWPLGGRMGRSASMIIDPDQVGRLTDG